MQLCTQIEFPLYYKTVKLSDCFKPFLLKTNCTFQLNIGNLLQNFVNDYKATLEIECLLFDFFSLFFYILASK